MNIFTGHKVLLRAVEPEDADLFFRDGADSHAQRFGDDIKLPVPKAHLEQRLAKQKDRTNDHVWLAIADKNTGELVGSTSVHNADKRHRSFEYGIAVFAASRGQGIATEAVALLLRYYFKELGYHRAQATVYEFNASSIALHEKLGFTREGTLRGSIFADGQYFDEIIFSMLADEFHKTASYLPEFPFHPPANR